MFVYSTPVNDVQRQLIVEFALANRLPSICGDRDFVSAGGLMSYWTDWLELRRKTATYVDKILRGANPGDLPIELPTKFELVINTRVAKALGLTIPQAVLRRADEVIQ
jgi:putative ABC transport system substrate-binding protein